MSASCVFVVLFPGISRGQTDSQTERLRDEEEEMKERKELVRWGFTSIIVYLSEWTASYLFGAQEDRFANNKEDEGRGKKCDDGASERYAKREERSMGSYIIETEIRGIACQFWGGRDEKNLLNSRLLPPLSLSFSRHEERERRTMSRRRAREGRWKKNTRRRRGRREEQMGSEEEESGARVFWEKKEEKRRSAQDITERNHFRSQQHHTHRATQGKRRDGMTLSEVKGLPVVLIPCLTSFCLAKTTRKKEEEAGKKGIRRGRRG